MDQPLWTPSPERVARSNLTRFRERLEARHGLAFDGYEALHRWTLRHPDAFWSELAHFADVRADRGDGTVLRHGDRMPGAEWFPTARLNYAENLLHFHDDTPAIIAWDERAHTDPSRRQGFEQLRDFGRVQRGDQPLRSAHGTVIQGLAQRGHARRLFRARGLGPVVDGRAHSPA